LSYDRPTLAAEAAAMALALNSEQRLIYDTVLSSVCQRQSFVYFIAGHGGTGKTFLWRAILAKLRSQDHIVLAVASSGVAALLMPGGRTTHSRFIIPLDIHDRNVQYRSGHYIGWPYTEDIPYYLGRSTDDA